MLIFHSFGGVGNLKGYSLKTGWSIGNIGYPSNICSKNIIDWASAEESFVLQFECQATTSVQKVLSSGIVSYDSQDDY